MSSKVTARDIEYRRQLGVGGGELPKAAGSGGATGNQSRAPRKRRQGDENTASKRLPKKPRGKGTQAVAKKPSAVPQTKGVKAEHAGTCPVCERRYNQGAAIGRTEKGWGHKVCADAVRETERIRAGETFRSRAQSTWRRGASPSSSRERY